MTTYARAQAERFPRRSIDEWQKAAKSNSDAHGFAVDMTNTPNVVMKLALLHTEVSEAVECCRKGEWQETTTESGKPEGLPSELADVAIRLFELAESLGIDLERAIARKHEYNVNRPHKHGGKAF